jgi:hypothetical protein
MYAQVTRGAQRHHFPHALHLNCLRIEGLSMDVVGLTLCAWLLCKQPRGRACWSYESPAPPLSQIRC